MPVMMTSFIIPASAALPYLVEDKYVKGGLRFIDTIVNRDAIHSFARKEGMLVYVQEDKTYYQLEADMVTWKGASLGGSKAVAYKFEDPLIASTDTDGSILVKLNSSNRIPASPGAGFVLTSGDKQSLAWQDMFGNQDRGVRGTVEFEASEFLMPGSSVDFSVAMASTVMLIKCELNAYDIELTGWIDDTRTDLNPYKFISTPTMLVDQGITVDDGKQVLHRRFALLTSANSNPLQYFRMVNLGVQPCKPKVTFTYLVLE